VKRAVVDRLADVGRADVFAAGEVRDGSGYLEDPVVGPRGEALPLHRTFEEGFALGIERTVLPDLRRGHRGIGIDAAEVASVIIRADGGVRGPSVEAGELDLACPNDAIADGGAWFAGFDASAAKLVKLYGGDIDVDI